MTLLHIMLSSICHYWQLLSQ